MSSPVLILEEMLQEFGKDSPEVENEIADVIGEITIDILNQNDGRFKGLQKTQDISITATEISAETTEFQLNSDFKTAKRTFIQVDSDGKFVAEIAIVDETEFYRRQGDTNYTSTSYTYIKYDRSGTPGYFLVFAAAHSDVAYYKFFYYREPMKEDTNIISNSAVIKAGVRARLLKYSKDPNAPTIYERMKSGVRENPDRLTTGSLFRPSKRIQTHNRRMKNIGRGN